jgi:hypothetical protein
MRKELKAIAKYYQIALKATLKTLRGGLIFKYGHKLITTINYFH